MPNMIMIIILLVLVMLKLDKTGVINDPLGQTHNPAGSDHYFHLKIVLFREILKSGDG